jgi:toxin ParE1/3/4
VTGYLLTPAAQAERYTLALRDACEALASGGKRGRQIDHIRPGYNKFAVGSHVLFFRRVDAGGIEVVRILHQRMDVETRL